MFFKIALLNILKHFKRSLVVLGAVMIAVLMMSLVSGLLKGISANFTTDLIPEAGHLQIKAQGVKKAANPFDLKFLIPQAEELKAQLQDPRILRAEKILSFGAMAAEAYDQDLTKPSNSMFMLGYGIQADTQFQKGIRQGLTPGSRFLSGGDQEILMGQKAVQLLGYKLGDRVDILTSDRSGAPINHAYVLVGTFKTGNDQVDENQFFITHGAAEELLDEGGKTREIRVLLKSQDASEALARDLAPLLAGFKAEGETWQAVFGSMLAIVKLLDLATLVLNLFFMIVAASIITNTILMTVFERIREYGTLRAIGLKSRQVFGMILIESGLLGFLGALAGLGASVPVLMYFQKNGLDIGDATNYMGVGNKLYATLEPGNFLLALVCGLGIALLAGVYAARVSAKLTVTESLAHI